MNSMSIRIIYLSASNSIRRDKFLTDVYEFGIPTKLVNMCRHPLTGTKSLFKVDGEKSKPFITTKGFRYGDGLSFDLFNICLEIIIRAANIYTSI